MQYVFTNFMWVVLDFHYFLVFKILSSLLFRRFSASFLFSDFFIWGSLSYHFNLLSYFQLVLILNDLKNDTYTHTHMYVCVYVIKLYSMCS